MTDHRFGKRERLKSRKAIQYLFDNGKTVKSFPLMLVFDTRDTEITEIKVGFSVSKKKFKRAVDRNKIKRMMRESFRLNKSELISVLEKEKLSSNMMLIYLKDKFVSYESLNESMVDLLQKYQLVNKIEHE